MFCSADKIYSFLQIRVTTRQQLPSHGPYISLPGILKCSEEPIKKLTAFSVMKESYSTCFCQGAFRTYILGETTTFFFCFCCLVYNV